MTVESATEGQCIQENWYCARTYSGREAGLAAALKYLGVETYLPLFTRRKTRMVNRYNPIKREYLTVPQPVDSTSALFPGYVFAKLGDSHWAAVKTRLGVHHRPQWVNFGDGPIVVDPELLVFIRNWKEEPVEVNHNFKRGDTLEILSGPFAGFAGLYSHDANERVMVLVSMLGRQPLIPFEPYQVQRIGDLA